MFKPYVVTVIVALSLVLGGCAGKSTKNDAAATDAGSGIASSGASDNFGAGTPVAGGGGSDDTSGLALQQRTVFFAFDSSDLDSEGQAIVTRFAKYLVAHPTSKLRLEGHADERGTREYNVGLGERRAIAVQAALVVGGASSTQILIVSYGEERLADPGHEEAAWAKNRRVEIIQL
ncbi:MAG: peptidoglycan-associated lipoprotein [Panacagrimonas sp.]